MIMQSEWKKIPLARIELDWCANFVVICKCYVSIGNSMICSDISHEYNEWYFKIVIRHLRRFWNITSGSCAKYHVQIMLLIVYTTNLRRFVIFTCRYFKLSWNTTALSQSNCINFSCSSIRYKFACFYLTCRYWHHVNEERLPELSRFWVVQNKVATLIKGLFTWSGRPRSSGVGFFCFYALGDTKQKKPTPLDRGPQLHVNRV